MVQALTPSAMDDLTLQADLAGVAFGCRFSSSAEYEAAIIAERRKAGIYRKALWRQFVPWTLTMLAAAIMTFSLSWRGRAALF